MKKSYLPIYDLKEEVFPALVICVLLNCIPLYFLFQIQSHGDAVGRFFSFLYMDMSGTILAAMLLGPWWAAVVAVIGSTLNGLFTSDYYPFIVVNIGGGVVLGYFLQATHHLKILYGDRHIIKILRSSLISVAWVGVACGILSWVVMLILYPEMNISLTEKPEPRYLYDFLHKLLLPINLDSNRAISLLIGDIVRDIIDKAISFALAIYTLRHIGFLPLKHNYRNRVMQVKISKFVRRIKTDGVPIIFFSIVYSCALIIARLFKHQVKLSEANVTQNAQSWLVSEEMVILLYSPLLLGIICFIFFNYNQDAELNRCYRIFLLTRQRLYRRFLKPAEINPDKIWNSELMRVFRKDGVYGLLFALLLWPGDKSLPFQSSILLACYVAATLGFIFFFFYSSRRRVNNLCILDKELSSIDNFTNVNSTPAIFFQSVLKLKKMMKLKLAIETSERVFKKGTWHLAPAIILSDSPLNLLDFKKTGVLLYSSTNNVLNNEDLNEIIQLNSELGSNWSIVCCQELANYNKEFLLKLSFHKSPPILLLGWQELELIAEASGTQGNFEKIIKEALVRPTDYLLNESSKSIGWDLQELSIELLLSRALPSVKHLIQRQPANSYILDMGAGRGRHTILALEAGYKVMAIDKDIEVITELNQLVEKSKWEGRIKVVHDGVELYKPRRDLNLTFIIVAGVLHHAKDKEALLKKINNIHDIADYHTSAIFFEILTDMKIDDQYPDDRLLIQNTEMEILLADVFHENQWQIKRLLGPIHRTQFFSGHGSFLRSYNKAEYTLSEYLIEPIL